MRMSNPHILHNLTSSIFQHVYSPREHWWSAIFVADRHRIIRLGESLSPYLLPPPPFIVPQWVASVSCSSSPCAQTAGHNYDPSLSGSDTGHNFEIQYLSGTVSGPIYWDRVHVGGYSVEFQALGIPIMTFPFALLTCCCISRCYQRYRRKPLPQLQWYSGPCPSAQFHHC